MRDASWNEMFAPRRDVPVLEALVPEEPRGWRRVLWWEDLVSFALLGVILLAVVASIDRANWVDSMPRLYLLAFSGLLLGALLARVRWPEVALHLIALPLGAAASLGQILWTIEGPTPWDRYDILHARMGDWFNAAFTGGISNDELPFIVAVVPACWVAAYLSSWAIFRWQNVWLALIPAGAVLLGNVSYLPGQFSSAFIVFLLGGALLITRLNLLERAKAWRDAGTPYPPLLSLSVLHTTFWLALALLIAAWVMPQANEASALESLWRRSTAPVTERVDSLARLFVSVDSQRGSRVHRFDDIAPFLGSIELPDTLALEVETEELDQPRYLRARSYGVYTPAGWKRSSNEQTSALDASEITGVDEELERRTTVTAWLTSASRLGDSLPTFGQPRRFDRAADVQWARVSENVTSAELPGGLEHDTLYQTVGSMSIATEEELRAAFDYPRWVRSLYTQLPFDFPERVHLLALDITRPGQNAYDNAVAIETYLRTIPYDLSVPETPPGRDSVDFFLFDVQRGYFDYYASAMVVMLRSIGIPARLAVGYVVENGQRVGDGEGFRVTEESAFAWPEVYFPGLGWVEFNPTPSYPTIERPGAEAAAAPEPAEAGPAPGLGLEDLPGVFGEEDLGPSELVAESSSSAWSRWMLLGIAAGVAAMAAVVAGGTRYAWVRGLGGLEPPARFWEQAVRLASWGRSPPAPAQTPREYARALRDEVDGLGDEIELMADAYVRHRFGGGTAAVQYDERLVAAWRGVRVPLLRRLFRLR